MGIKKLSGQLRDSHDITHTVEAESLSEKPADHSPKKDKHDKTQNLQRMYCTALCLAVYNPVDQCIINDLR